MAKTIVVSSVKPNGVHITIPGEGDINASITYAWMTEEGEELLVKIADVPLNTGQLNQLRNIATHAEAYVRDQDGIS